MPVMLRLPLLQSRPGRPELGSSPAVGAVGQRGAWRCVGAAPAARAFPCGVLLGEGQAPLVLFPKR